MPRVHFQNDPNFGARKRWGGKTFVPSRDARPRILDGTGATQSEYASGPQYMAGINDTQHQGADVLFPKPDYFSNPNSAEHVKSFPDKLREEGSRSWEFIAICALGALIVVLLLSK